MIKNISLLASLPIELLDYINLISLNPEVGLVSKGNYNSCSRMKMRVLCKIAEHLHPKQDCSYLINFCFDLNPKDSAILRVQKIFMQITKETKILPCIAFEQFENTIANYRKLLKNDYLIFLKKLPRSENAVKDLLKLEHCSYLQLSNQLTTWISKNPEVCNITSLDLSYCELFHLPPQIGSFSKLLEINLSHNQLRSLPKEIGYLSNLEYLNFSNNQLQEFPIEICHLHEIEHLHISHNQFELIPKEIVNFSRLKFLYLSHNQLQSLPKEISNLHNLVALQLCE